MVTEPPEETSAGKVAWSARTVFPPSPAVTPVVRQVSAKLKTKSSSERRAIRATALGARLNSSKRVGLGFADVQVLVPDEAMTELGTGVAVADRMLVTMVVLLEVVFDAPYGAAMAEPVKRRAKETNED